ncbi:ParA family protein [Sphingomonas sp. SRS2]|uniref:ParA family protein n=1 Tax=Sphingomonas sp. SRS2 TaxID=133190 RepID=UPI0006184973|nr:ParA family protein [Sphingomonas sp. SRS2]KKC24255.1 hypothetical protein WP12_20330 [Sphingomonas sp. SRS2]
MPVIAFVTPKGGAGKTTATVLIASELAERGQTVAILDADPNQPLAAWATKDIAPPTGISIVSDVTEDSMIDTVEQAAEQNDWVLIDVEGSANLASAYAISQSDLIIIPAQKTQLDAKEAVRAIKMVRDAQKVVKTEIPFRLLFMRTNARVMAGVQKAVQSAFQEIPALPVEIAERSAFQAIFAYGGSIKSLPKGVGGNVRNAQENVEAVVDAVIAALKTSARRAAA